MPDTSVDTTPPHADLELRAGRLEHEMGDVKAILGQMLPLIVRIDATMPHLATKAELHAAFGTLDGKISDLRSEMHSELGTLRAELAEKPSKTYLWMVLGVLIMAYAAGLAGLAILK
jgi:hypothetical protein